MLPALPHSISIHFLSRKKTMELNFKEKLALALHLFPAAIIVGSCVGVATAKAEPVGEGCVSDFWMWRGLRASSRMICDSDRRADGSWERRRGFFANEYYVPFRCSRYSCYGGYWVDELKVIERYIVTDDTVLPDEPGWIPSTEPRVVA